MALTKVQLVDLNANELIIDLDGDTSITADTDDQIDIKIAGADDFRFTANTFTALSGSTIAAQALTATSLTTTGAIAIPNDGNIGSAGDADAIAISSSGVVTFSQSPVFPDGSLAVVDLDIDGATDIGANLADADLLIVDDGAGGTNRKTAMSRVKTYIADVTLTTAAQTNITSLGTLTALTVDDITIDGSTISDSGDFTIDGGADIILDADGADIILKDGGTTFASLTNSSGELVIKSGSTPTTAATFSGANVTLAGTVGSGAITSTSTIQGTTITATTAFVPDAANGASLGTTALEFADLYLHDGAQILWGADQDVLLTHVADAGLSLKTSATGDDTKATLTLQTGETDIAVNDVLGAIDFQAPDEGTGTDAILVAAGIAAVSEGDFSSSNNATKLSFKTAASEAAAEKMSLSSAGVLTTSSNIVSGGNVVIADAGNIGSASDTDAIAISSGGVVTMNQIPVFSAGINVSGGSIAGTLSTAAQANITSLGTLTALTVDDVAVDGKVITMTGSSSDTAVFTAGTNGTLSIVTTDDSAAAANITITADGTAELAGTTVTLNSGGDIVLDADGADLKFADGGTDLLSITNSSSDVVFKPLVDAKDIIFHQYDGTSILEINDGGYARFTAAAINPEITLSDASTISWNALTQPVAKVTLAGNRTMAAASGGIAGQFVSVLVIQDGTGSRTLTWNAAYEFAADTAPTLTTTASKGDLFVFRYNGSKWLEVGRNLNLTLS